MVKKRKKIPINIKRTLIIETGNKCAMTNCPHETGLEIHHIDSNPENNEINNLLLLCAVHHSQVTKGILDAKTCELLKANLKINHTPISLSSRNEFIKSAINYLNDSNQSYRNITVGPLFLSPDWFMRKRNEEKTTPNFDIELKKFILKNTNDRNHDIRIMFSLSNRYKIKIEALINKADRKLFIEDVLKNLYLVFGDDYSKGPDICCCHVGFSNIDMIFDDALISTFRPNQETPTSSGLLYLEPNTINNARMKFDEIFDNNSKGQRKELNRLTNFIKNLW